MTKYSGGTHYEWQIPPHPTLYSSRCYGYGRVLAQNPPNYGTPQPTLINTEYQIDLDRLRYAGWYTGSSGHGNNMRHHFWDDWKGKNRNISAIGNYFVNMECYDATDSETEFTESDYDGGKKNRKSKRRKSLSKRRKSLKKKQRKTKRKGRR